MHAMHSSIAANRDNHRFVMLFYHCPLANLMLYLIIVQRTRFLENKWFILLWKTASNSSSPHSANSRLTKSAILDVRLSRYDHASSEPMTARPGYHVTLVGQKVGQTYFAQPRNGGKSCFISGLVKKYFCFNQYLVLLYFISPNLYFTQPESTNWF